MTQFQHGFWKNVWRPATISLENNQWFVGESICTKIFQKLADQTLIKKSGLDANVLKNYRPVSNLPYVSKILEKVVDTRLESHLSLNNLHEEPQSAYRKFHSTETALLKVQNDILNSLDRNDVTMLVMLDLSAAFDTIDHTTLLTAFNTTLVSQANHSNG